MKEHISKEVQLKYLDPSPARAEAMLAFVRIRASDRDPADATAVIRRLRQGKRLSRLTAPK
jgi:hypothetical protein